MKRWLLITASSLIFAAFAACGNGGDLSSDSEESQSSASAKEQAANAVEEQILLDRDGVRITLKGFADRDDESDSHSAQWKLLIENGSDKDITVQARDVYVNGVMARGYMSWPNEVMAGKKSNTSLAFALPYMHKAKIELFKDVELKFHIYDQKSGETLIGTEPIYVACNKGAEYIQAYDDSGKELLSQDGIRIVLQGLESDSEEGIVAFLYFENNRSKDVTIQVRNASANGYMLDPIFSCDISKGMKVYDGISFATYAHGVSYKSSSEVMEFAFIAFEKEGSDTIFESDRIAIAN